MDVKGAAVVDKREDGVDNEDAVKDEVGTKDEDCAVVDKVAGEDCAVEDEDDAIEDEDDAIEDCAAVEDVDEFAVDINEDEDDGIVPDDSM